MERNLSRRGFLGSSSLGVAAAALPVSRAVAQSAADLKPGSLILFQGDSITDAMRSRNHQDEPNSPFGMGYGYPFLIASYLLATAPTRGLKFLNRGISGHKVPDLDARWQKDTIDLKPDILSILIGVNDIWHKLNGNYNGTVVDYETGYAALLERTRKALPDTRIVICEPFVLRCGAVNEKWFPEFDQRRAAAKRVAEDAGLTFIPFQAKFDEAVAEGSEPTHWGADGVHPSMAGHCLMAMNWLESVWG